MRRVEFSGIITTRNDRVKFEKTIEHSVIPDKDALMESATDALCAINDAYRSCGIGKKDRKKLVDNIEHRLLDGTLEQQLKTIEFAHTVYDGVKNKPGISS